jgi:uncharacterized protein
MITTWLLAFLTGTMFGILLQKARILRVERVIASLRFRDMTVLKFLLSAVLIGSTGIRLLYETGLIQLSHKPMNMGGVVLGGIIFGCGLPFLCFCPGTAGGALAEGRWHAIFGMLGMLAGGGLFAWVYPLLKPTVLGWKDYGALGLPEAFGIPAWGIIAVLWVVVTPIFFWLEKRKL